MVIRKRRSTRCGAAAVEFALVAPVLLLLLFGMVEVGNYLRATQMMTNISRDAAREASAEGTTPAGYRKYLDDLFEKMGVEGLPIQVVLDPSDPRAPAGTPVRATASIGFRDFHWYPPFMLRGAKVKAATVMRKEGS